MNSQPAVPQEVREAVESDYTMSKFANSSDMRHEMLTEIASLRAALLQRVAPAPISDEREAFEAKYPVPANCTWTGLGYGATSYGAWAAHTHIARWEGWKARAAAAPQQPAAPAAEQPEVFVRRSAASGAYEPVSERWAASHIVVPIDARAALSAAPFCQFCGKVERSYCYRMACPVREALAAPQAESAPVAAPTERSAKDYAIEHAEYMAVNAERLLSTIDALSAAELRREEHDDDDGTVADARDDVWSATRSLRCGIYEFRKRRERALSAVQPDEAIVNRGLARLQHVVQTLQETGRFVDDEGEDTQALADLGFELSTAGLAVQPEQPQSDTVDAARYRWLRDKARGVDWSERFQAGAYRHYCRTSPDQMDAAIDAALSKSVQAATGGARYCDTCEQMVTEPCNSVDCSTPE